MARLNTANTRPAGGKSPIRTATGMPNARTAEGARGYTRDAKSDLFLLAVGSFHGEDSFYESASDRTRRFRGLVRTVTMQDPVWVRSFLAWLRGPEANIRTGALVGAAEFVKVRLENDQHGGNREVIASVLQRADEPAELLAYWMSQYGKAIPKPVKRGLGDAVIRLGTEYAYAKYDSSKRAVKYADVLNLVHPGDTKGSAQHLRGFQGPLFELATSSPYRDVEVPAELPMLKARESLMATPVAERRALVLNEPQRLADAGITWEALAGWLQGPRDAKAWEAVIPQMGIMALIRNLRNFDEAGVSRGVAESVAAKIADPEVVAKSRQLPFRWLSAYEAVSSDRWKTALGYALEHSTRNIPELSGRTLILVDGSGSMHSPMSGKSNMQMIRAAGLFGASLAARLGPERVNLVAYAETSKEVPLPKGGSVLAHVGALGNAHVGMATLTEAAVRQHYKGHDRVMIFTDGQAWGWSGYGDYGRGGRVTKGGQSGLIDAVQGSRLYTWNLQGYQVAQAPSGEQNSQEIGGLSDATFKLIPLMERGRDAKYPWED